MKRSRVYRWYAAGLLGLLLVTMMLTAAPAAYAHGGDSVAYSDITLKDGDITYDLRIDMYDLRLAVAPNDIDVGDFSAPVLDKLIHDRWQDIENYLLDKIKLYADSLPLEGDILSLVATEARDQPYAEAVMRFHVGNKPEHFVLDYQPIFDDVDMWHVNYVTMSLDGSGGGKQSYVLSLDTREIKLGELSTLRAIKQFFILGIEHLITGYDHILFLLGLLIGARSIKQMLGVITSFTAAHTVTLLLAGFGVVTLPSRFVESVIALSIIYVALNSVLNKKHATKHNMLLAFGFGLIHGFGFAGTLSEMRLDGGQLAASLLTFNVGIEFGQIMIVLLLFPAVHYGRRIKWTIPAMSAAISCCGLIWLIQRAFM
ncbi:HupE/UreJ protein [Paenibacillus cellulosilyticus]|uniref:HupE/UreJ protein n=1 Tax=Paenibacillus cellulosilyticus TaxID=375489 RepID=A0A2V2YZP3_9BACL|nr:HupE/UreJ family protein [Paenibacillus cellulosilyticus]PWW08589.1 HupE/UreJ protein [Paenibacillus cellulosilyticus]QKS48158.1 HupE/UreJ family protein [Paenibacillus cellulosilyticus]